MSERVRLQTDGSITFFNSEGEKLMTLDASEGLVSLPLEYPDLVLKLSDVILKQAKENERLRKELSLISEYWDLEYFSPAVAAEHALKGQGK